MSDRPDSGEGSDPAPSDPVLVQRAKMQRFADVGQRFGYSLFGVAVLLFFVSSPAI